MIIFTLKDILTHCDVSSGRYNNRQFLGLFCLHGDVKRGVRRGGERLENFSLHFTFYTHMLFFLSYICFISLFYKFYFICKKEFCIDSKLIFFKCTQFNSKIKFFYYFIIQVLILFFYLNFFSKNAYDLLFPLPKSIHHKYSFFYLVIHYYVFNQCIFDLIQSRMLI
jgi:hypothetical protein